MTENRYPEPFPPPFADAWGDDEYGLWAEFHLPLAGAERPVIQRLRWIEPGTFLMGSPEDEPQRSYNEGPQHLVRLTWGYWLADTACTQALWLAVLGDNPSRFTGDPERPVEQVDWRRVQGFLRALEGLLPGVSADLPTEAEWEYACRAGTATPFSFGATITPEQVNYDGNYPYAGGEPGLYRETTVPVKSLPANPWGLYEMHGNVDDPTGPLADDDQPRMVRGGSWIRHAWLARSAVRYRFEPDFVLSDRGFRLCLRSSEPGPDPARAAGAAPKGRRGEAGGRAEAEMRMVGCVRSSLIQSGWCSIWLNI